MNQKSRKNKEKHHQIGLSPPKTCVLLELLDDKAQNTALDNHNQMSSCVDDGGYQNKLSHLQEFQISSLSFPETTPILKDPGSTVRIGKHLGESTLKKELWTKFDSASTNGFAFKVSVLQDTNKGFLERLEEVSCEDEI